MAAQLRSRYFDRPNSSDPAEPRAFPGVIRLQKVYEYDPAGICSGWTLSASATELVEERSEQPAGVRGLANGFRENRAHLCFHGPAVTNCEGLKAPLHRFIKVPDVQCRHCRHSNCHPGHRPGLVLLAPGPAALI
jgi:hypothetical protein